MKILFCGIILFAFFFQSCTPESIYADDPPCKTNNQARIEILNNFSQIGILEYANKTDSILYKNTSFKILPHEKFVFSTNSDTNIFRLRLIDSIKNNISYTQPQTIITKRCNDYSLTFGL